ncbi:hypothetical protein, partial [Candidatus Ichthyocystis hellenicum]
YRNITNVYKNCGIGSEYLNMSSVYCKSINKYIIGMAPDNDIIVDGWPVEVILLFCSLILFLGIVVDFVLGKCRSSRRMQS